MSTEQHRQLSGPTAKYARPPQVLVLRLRFRALADLPAFAFSSSSQNNKPPRRAVCCVYGSPPEGKTKSVQRCTHTAKIQISATAFICISWNDPTNTPVIHWGVLLRLHVTPTKKLRYYSTDTYLCGRLDMYLSCYDYFYGH
jgi:hypothetical protein